MKCVAAKSNLTVTAEAWLSLTDSMLDYATKAKFNALGSPDLIWVHWGHETANLNGRVQLALRDQLSRVIRRQVRNGGDVILESAAGLWPGVRGQRGDKRDISVFTCGLGAGHCQQYRVLTTLELTDVGCVCGLLGENRPESREDKAKCYSSLCMYLHGSQRVAQEGAALCASLGDAALCAPSVASRDPSLAPKRPSFAGQSEIHEVEAFPTEQAIRQKEARKLKGNAFREAGMAEGDIKKAVVKRKVQMQEDHHDDCGSDVGPIDDTVDRVHLALSHGSMEETIAYCFPDDLESYEDSRRSLQYPVGEGVAAKPKRGRPRKYPEGVIFDCPACRKSLPSIDPKHTRREEPPELCRHPDKESDPRITCPGCIANRSYDHPSHTGDLASCRVPGSRKYGKRAKAGPHRDPSTPAIGEATGRNPQSHDFDLDLDLGEAAAAPFPSLAPPGLSSADSALAREEVGEAAAEEGADGAAAASARERRVQTVERERSARHAEASNQSDNAAAEDWRAFDLKKAFSALRSPDAATRRKALQRLHIRWWHVPSEPFKRTLEAAGAPAEAIAEIPSVVQGCVVCRDWRKPGPRNVTTFRLVMEFNEEVQFDLLFYHSLLEPERGNIPIAHLIDACVRFSRTGVTRKDEISLTTTIAALWISLFGPMGVLVLDEETGMRGQAVIDWSSTHGVHLKFKAPRQKAWIVERHNEVLRRGLHGTESQLLAEDIRVPFEQVLATVTFMGNSLTVVNTSTPYQAVLGRQPAMLPPLDGGHLGQVESMARPETNARFEARVREVAAVNIIESLAVARLDRASRSKTRGAIELSQHSVGDLVDIWFEPANKDQKGWRGPAEIRSINADEGNFSVRFQGRTLDRRNQEVRPHLPYLVYASILQPHYFADWILLKEECQALRRGTIVVFGFVWNEQAPVGWVFSRASHSAKGRELLQAGLAVANAVIHIPACTTVRLWRGLPQASLLKGGFTHSEVFVWTPSVSTDIDQEMPAIFSCEPGDLTAPIPAKALAQEILAHGARELQWQDVCFAQFLGLDESDADRIVLAHPDINMLGGAGFERLGAQRGRSGDSVPAPAAGPTVPSAQPPPGLPTSVSSPVGAGQGAGPHLLPTPLPQANATPIIVPMVQPSVVTGPDSRAVSPQMPAPLAGPQASPWPAHQPPPASPNLVPHASTLGMPDSGNADAWNVPIPGTPAASTSYLDPDDTVMGLRRVLRQSMTPESVRSRSPRPRSQEQATPKPVLPLRPDSITPTILRSRSPRQGHLPSDSVPPSESPDHPGTPYQMPGATAETTGSARSRSPFGSPPSAMAKSLPARVPSSQGDFSETPASLAPTIQYGDGDASGTPASLAPTVQYGDEDAQSPAPAEEYGDPVVPHCPAKRAAESLSPGDRRVAKAHKDCGTPQGRGAASSSDPSGGPVLLPVRQPSSEDEGVEAEDEEEYERALVAWKAELDAEGAFEEKTDLNSICRSADLCRLSGEKHNIQAIDAYWLDMGGDKSSGAACHSEIAVEGCLARCHSTMGHLVLDGDCLVYSVSSAGTGQPTIVRDVGALTSEELRQHRDAVSAAKLKEVKGLHDLGCLARFLRSRSRNRVDTRWVLAWKWVDGARIIKARLTMRGFKDRCLTMETYAGTATRAGQRIVNSQAALDPDFVLFSFDVSQAFAKGMTFEQIAQLTGAPLREVEFDLAPEDVQLLHKLPGWSDFDPARETIRMLKPVYGLKDAPRAWRKRLHQVLASWGACQLLAEPELYALHEPSASQFKPKVESIEHKVAAEQHASQDRTSPPVEEWLADRRAQLKCILSTHVDDLKGTARRAVAESLLKHLEAHFGKCKSEWGRFSHTGIWHEHRPGEVICHQREYVAALRAMNLTSLKGKEDHASVSEETHREFQTLLGGAAWTVLTRADAAVYIQALQRRAHAPRVIDCKRLNVVVRFLKREHGEIRYGNLQGPHKLIGFSDSAFKAQDGESSGLALRGLAIFLAEDKPGTIISGGVHLLDFVVRRLKRVVRSTFAAELNALTDAVETIILEQLILHQVFCGTTESAEQLLHRLENGRLYPPMEALIDAQSVFDALVAPDAGTPLEASLKVHIISIRDRLARGVLRKIGWTDTRDMVADGLNKGGIPRQALQAAMAGKVSLAHPVKQHSCVVGMASPSSSNLFVNPASLLEAMVLPQPMQARHHDGEQMRPLPLRLAQCLPGSQRPPMRQAQQARPLPLPQLPCQSQSSQSQRSSYTRASLAPPYVPTMRAPLERALAHRRLATGQPRTPETAGVCPGPVARDGGGHAAGPAHGDDEKLGGKNQPNRGLEDRGGEQLRPQPAAEKQTEKNRSRGRRGGQKHAKLHTANRSTAADPKVEDQNTADEKEPF